MAEKNKTQRTDALVLLSGGRDSLLSACIAIEQGHRIIPAVCDTGHIEGVDRVNFSVDALRERYGSEAVGSLVKIHTGMTLLSYMRPTWQGRLEDLWQLYPKLQMYQAHCLACKTAMYAHAVAYCMVNGIHYLVDGMREEQGFFVEQDEMRARFEELCAVYGITLITPVLELSSDLERKQLLCSRGMPTKTLEPQCFLGCPLTGPLTKEEKKSLSDFYDMELRDLVRKDAVALHTSYAFPVLKSDTKTIENGGNHG